MRDNLDIYYGLRTLYTAVAYFILLNGLISIDDKVGILSSFFLFLIPIALDYFNQQPLKAENRKRVQNCMWLALVLAIFVLILMMGTAFNDFVKTVWFKFGLWGILVTFIIAAIRDWITFSSPEEVKHRKLVREACRKNVEDHIESMGERLTYYEQEIEKIRPSRERSQRARTGETVQ
ncbi:hypothetical protein MOC94_21930 [Bacillus haynesii]|uniref:hypothetical protein n=1 Tax=Bacillus haynesii TaxID=1925021 RepID=UPI0022829C7B|nr:hypothetical protein [Bacillus haynesii]MCY8385804.1 hypothetical protein [Bacillus haynesii]